MKKQIEGEFDDIDNYKDDFKIDQVPKTYVLITNHWKTIEENLPKKSMQLLQFIGRYRSKWIDRLETPYPIDYPPWTPENEKILYEVTGIDRKAFVDDVMTIRGWEGYEDTYLGDKAPYILMNLIVRWFWQHDQKDKLRVMEYFVGYSHYWASFTVFFKPESKKGFKPSLDIMKYTIEQMSYKSRLKALGSVDRWLYEGVADTYQTYEKRLMRGSDFELHYINEKIRGKFKSAFKTIFRAYDKNMREGNRVFSSSSFVDDEIVEIGGNASEAIGLSNSYTTKFFADPINEDILKKCLVPGGITEKDLRIVLQMIADNQDNIEDVRKLYQSLLYTFLENPKYKSRDIGSIRFFSEMDRLYKPGNTNDPNKIFIKDILDKWLAMGSKTFRTTNRTATITTFRKSIYNYFIFKIAKDR